MPAQGLDLTESLAKSFFESGTKPDLSFLTSRTWTQVGGLPLYDAAQCPWAPGPMGISETGQFSAVMAMGKPRIQPKTIFFFESMDGKKLLHLRSAPPQKSDSSIPQLDILFHENKTGITFSIAKENNSQMALDFPSDYGNSSAEYECRITATKFLICSAVFHATNPKFAPSVLKPFINKVFYYALFKKTSDILPLGMKPAGEPQKILGQKVKTYRCAMKWKGNSTKIEMMSFTMLNAPAKLGGSAMLGVGGSWEANTPKDIQRVVITNAIEENGATKFGIVNASNNYLNAEWDITKQVTNLSGLQMIGSITIPFGGGISEIRYPPGWAQDAKAYAQTLSEAPSQGNCQEVSIAAPSDPYAQEAGIVK